MHQGTSIVPLACLAILGLSALGCSTGDSSTDDAPPQEKIADDPPEVIGPPPQEETSDELESATEWSAEFGLLENEQYEIRLIADGETVKRLQRYEEGGRMPESYEFFTTTYCGEPTLVLITATVLSTGISGGTLYENIIFHRDDHHVLATIVGGVVRDREDGSYISNSQPDIEEQLSQGTMECSDED